MDDVELGETFATADALEASGGKDAQAIALLLSIINTERESDEVARLKELSIYKLGALYARAREPERLRALLQSVRPFFATVAKAKTAKIVRSLIDLVALIPDTLPLQIELCRDSIEWCRAEKRSFLRQRIESRLAALLLDAGEYNKALELLAELLREVKRLDDKPLLVEIQLIEARAHHALRNQPKAKASLTSARTAANSIYCPPSLQAQIDLMAGTLHADEKDYKTAFSYFYEALENSEASANPAQAVLCLKYMLLTKVGRRCGRGGIARARGAGRTPGLWMVLRARAAKRAARARPPLRSPRRLAPLALVRGGRSRAQVMTDNGDEVNAIISGKAGLRHAGEAMDAMRAVAGAHKKRSLKAFEEATRTYAAHLRDDPLVAHHLDALYDILLQANICRIIEPFSRCAHARPLARLFF